MLIYQVVERAYALVQGNKPLVRVLTIERRIEMTEKEANIIINKEHDKDLLKQEYYTFINACGLSDCFENVVEFLDKCGVLKTKI